MAVYYPVLTQTQNNSNSFERPLLSPLCFYFYALLCRREIPLSVMELMPRRNSRHRRKTRALVVRCVSVRSGMQSCGMIAEIASTPAAYNASVRGNQTPRIFFSQIGSHCTSRNHTDEYYYKDRPLFLVASSWLLLHPLLLCTCIFFLFQGHSSCLITDVSVSIILPRKANCDVCWRC